MCKYIFRGLLLILLFSFSPANNLFGQSKKELQLKKRKLQKEINYTNSLLKETEKSKKTSLNQLRQLNKKISIREQLITAMEMEVQLFEDSIQKQQHFIDSLQIEVDTLKIEYAEMIKRAYKNKNAYQRLMFLFSADDFNQAYKRLKYFQQYAAYRELQADRIVSTQDSLDANLQLLEAIRNSKEGLLKAKLNERNVLSSEKSKKQEVVNSLKGKEKQLKKDLKSKQAAAKKIQNAIAKIIEDEIRRAREAAKKAGKSSKGFPMTPEAIELSNSFAANKGKLPWPVGEGVITGKFGEHPHPSLKNVKVQNNGIDISTKKGNMGRAIFDGTVSRVLIIPGEGKVVMIRHGEYFSVYHYFKEVFVSAGDVVTTKQNLGILLDNQEATSNMHLEIWKTTTKLNPASWIFNK